VAAGNAHLNVSVICGGLIEHERFVLLRTKQLVQVERSEIGLALRVSRNLPPGPAGSWPSTKLDMRVARCEPTSCSMLSVKSPVISVSCELPARLRRQVGK
jgi:hypothetical protein